jgi:hypothetical protein
VKYNNVRSGKYASKLPARFWDKVEILESGCWRWTGTTDGRGYGFFRVAEGMRRTHRLAYVDAKGDIPDGLVIDHLCRNKRML